MYCAHCGKEIPDESQFCGYCGKAALKTSAVVKPQETVPPPRTDKEESSLPDSESIRNIPVQTEAAAELKPEEKLQKAPGHKKKVIALTIIAVLALGLTVLGVLDMVGGTGAKQAVQQVQNGYLGGYDDVTINEMLTYVMEGFKVTWDGWASDNEAYLVEVRVSDGENTDNDVVIQFKTDNEGLFRLSGIKASDLDTSNTAEVMKHLNMLYYQYYLFQVMEDDIDADATKVMNQMSNIPVGIVMYGTPADYKGNRLDSCLDRASDVEKRYTVGEILWGIVPDSSTPDNPSFGGTTQSGTYDSVISLYATALHEGWGFDQLEAAGLNYMCGYYTNPSDLGYILLDIDHNGTEELIVGEIGEYGGGSGFFFDLYTLVGGQPSLVINSGERDQYYLCNDGYIMNEGSDSASTDYCTYYGIDIYGNLALAEAVIYDDEVETEGPWFYSVTGLEPADRSPISEQVAQQIVNKHTCASIEFIPFS